MRSRRMGTATSAVMAAYYICHDSVSHIGMDEIKNIGERIKKKHGIHVSTFNIPYKVKEIRREFCKHEKLMPRILRSKIPVPGEGNAFLEERLVSDFRNECVHCGAVLASKKIMFTLFDVLRVIRDINATKENTCLMDFVVRFEELYYICTKKNDDYRKELSTRYMSLRLLITPLLDAGLIAIEKKTGTYKRLFLTDKGMKTLREHFFGSIQR